MENQNIQFNTEQPSRPRMDDQEVTILNDLTLRKKPQEIPLIPAPLWDHRPSLEALEKPKWNEKKSALPISGFGLDQVLKGELLLKPGSENQEQVSQLQDLLRSKGYKINDSNGLYRGVYGEQTKKAVTRFQKMQGLSPDGVVGPKTLKALVEYDYKPVVLPAGLRVKNDSVDIGHLHLKLQETFPHILEVWKNNDAPSPVITSGNDSKHSSPASKHYSDRAIDLRGNNVSDTKLRKMAAELREKLGAGYFVQAEFPPDNPAKDHIHVEWDPKK